jgi:hypothetical protein
MIDKTLGDVPKNKKVMRFESKKSQNERKKKRKVCYNLKKTYFL